jgi:hypothetical protein
VVDQEALVAVGLVVLVAVELEVQAVVEPEWVAMYMADARQCRKCCFPVSLVSTLEFGVISA